MLDCRGHQDWMVYREDQVQWDLLDRKAISVPQVFLEFRDPKVRKEMMEYLGSRVCPEFPGPWDQEGRRDHLAARRWRRGLWDVQAIQDHRDRRASKDFKAHLDLWDPQEARASQGNEGTQEKLAHVVSRENQEPKEHQGVKVHGACRVLPDAMVCQVSRPMAHPHRAYLDPKAFLVNLGLKDHRVKRAVVAS